MRARWASRSRSMRDQRVLRTMKTPRSSAERPFPTSSAVTCAHTTLRLIEARQSLGPFPFHHARVRQQQRRTASDAWSGDTWATPYQLKRCIMQAPPQCILQSVRSMPNPSKLMGQGPTRHIAGYLCAAEVYNMSFMISNMNSLVYTKKLCLLRSGLRRDSGSSF